MYTAGFKGVHKGIRILDHDAQEDIAASMQILDRFPRKSPLTPAKTAESFGRSSSLTPFPFMVYIRTSKRVDALSIHRVQYRSYELAPYPILMYSIRIRELTPIRFMVYSILGKKNVEGYAFRTVVLNTLSYSG